MKIKEGQIWYVPELDQIGVIVFDLIQGMILHAQWFDGGYSNCLVLPINIFQSVTHTDWFYVGDL